MRVSRPTIGEAIKLMVGAGVVQARRGATGGLFVAPAVSTKKLLGLSSRPPVKLSRDFIEARRAVEMELAQLAAERATEADFRIMAESIALLRDSKRSPAKWLHANNVFHYTIGRAAQSEVLARYQHEIIEALSRLIQHSDPSFGDAAATIRHHEHTLAALRTRNGTLVSKAMADHLSEFERNADAANPMAMNVVRTQGT
jgi:GntR family transcriptional repressor for pyruvate dehydrogenase complex